VVFFTKKKGEGRAVRRGLDGASRGISEKKSGVCLCPEVKRGTATWKVLVKKCNYGPRQHGQKTSKCEEANLRMVR